MTEIIKFKLPMIENLSLVNTIVSMGYRKTGNKFSINFNGSKGYLSNVEITCEGSQKHVGNIIWIEKLHNKNRTLMSKLVTISYSEDEGITVAIDGIPTDTTPRIMDPVGGLSF